VKSALIRVFPAKRGECGLFVVCPLEGVELTVRAWRGAPLEPWKILPQQADGIVLTQLGRIRVEELINS
jgi:hypothetical protein